MQITSEAVKTSTLIPGSSLPLLVTPGSADVDLSTWIRGNRETVDDWLTHHGGILFRGFEIDNPSKFHAVLSSGSAG